MNDISKDKLEKLKVIVSEVDGIITEHLSAIDPMGYVVFKQYYMKDFEAINELKKTFTFVFLSLDDIINYKVCRDRNIPFFHNKKSKKEELIKIMRKYDVTPDEVLYLGSSFSDLECMQLIPFSVCPSDSVDAIQRIATYVLSIPSGIGVLCELYNILSDEILRRKREE